MASKVYLVKEPFLTNLEKAMGKFDLKRRFSGKSTAVKAHMGEYENLNYVRPVLLGKAVEILQNAYAKPFVFDSPTSYHRKRHTVRDYIDTARRNGFTKETIGCEIKISDEALKEKGTILKRVNVCRDIADAEAMIVLSHGKGHVCGAYGGAIKNLGMGAVDIATKDAIHDNAAPLIDREKCTGCAACIEVCHPKANSLKNRKISIDYDKCWGCGRCIKACKYGALKPKLAFFNYLLADSAGAVLRKFQRENVLYVTMLMSIAPRCDCNPRSGMSAMPDIGILVSDDIAAIDAAAIDLINKTFGKDWFESLKYRNPKEQIEMIEKLGLGSGKCKLEEIGGN
ncbi:MAG: DUF362 domain-containing protein [Candidatus Diapherotrites archaeon]|nr:DUF362 domain-containing protein [Candidatus Diapherotrites archaeon]